MAGKKFTAFNAQLMEVIRLLFVLAKHSHDLNDVSAAKKWPRL